MDHEHTNIAGQRLARLEPHLAVPCLHHDWAHIMGGKIARNQWSGCLALLGEIYRIDPEHAAQGRNALIAAMRTAYRRTRTALRDNPSVHDQFQPSFVHDALAWEEIVADYRAGGDSVLGHALASRGIERPDQYRAAFSRYGDWLIENPYLFAADDEV